MLSFNYSGVVQLVARQPLELVILVRVQAPEPIFPDIASKFETPAARDFAQRCGAAAKLQPPLCCCSPMTVSISPGNSWLRSEDSHR